MAHSSLPGSHGNSTVSIESVLAITTVTPGWWRLYLATRGSDHFGRRGFEPVLQGRQIGGDRKVGFDRSDLVDHTNQSVTKSVEFPRCCWVSCDELLQQLDAHEDRAISSHELGVRSREMFDVIA